MSQETCRIVNETKLDRIDLQLAFQCAPLIVGLKPSNIFNISSEDYFVMLRILRNSKISWHVLGKKCDKMMIFLYHRESLDKYLKEKEVRKILREEGYICDNLDCIIKEFENRYRRYLQKNVEFPHEMGLLLGYPAEDVLGFIKYKGDKSIYTGYWKVYKNKEKKMEIFRNFENAKERLIQLLSYGVGMTDILDICCSYV